MVQVGIEAREVGVGVVPRHVLPDPRLRHMHVLSFNRSRHTFYIHTAWCLPLKRQAEQAASIYHTCWRTHLQLYQIKATTTHTYCMAFTT